MRTISFDCCSPSTRRAFTSPKYAASCVREIKPGCLHRDYERRFGVDLEASGENREVVARIPDIKMISLHLFRPWMI